MPHISDGRPPTESRVLCVGARCARRRQPQRQMPKQRSMLLL